jgi:stage II sporulation protein AB (anti-sigma F factor)
MNVKNEMKLSFLSRSQNEAFARVAVAAFAAQLDPTLEEIADIKTAVSEAVTNAIIHGYDNPNEMVEIITRIYDNCVEIEVIDQGKGIENIELARQPLYTSKPELERSGMGFTVMETFMDELEVISAPSQGTKVRMVKYISDDVQETERD